VTSWEHAGPQAARTRCRWRPLCSAGLVCLAVLAMAGQARATSYSPSDAFYWSLPSGAAAGIAVSPDGNSVYVANSSLKRIEQFDSDGVLLRSWASRKAWQAPSSVTTDGFGNVYVLYPQPLNQAPATIVKYTGVGKVLASWTVPFAGSIAASRGGIVYVLTNFLNAVGVYDTDGKSIGGFVANLPGQWFPEVGFDPRYWPQTGYDPPYKTVARAITVDPSGDAVVVGDSLQSLSDPQPDCSIPDQDDHIDTQPYPDPLDSGEAVRFTPDGTPIAYGWLSLSQQNCYNGLYQQSPGVNVADGWQSDGTNPSAVAVDPNGGDVYAVTSDQLGVRHLAHDLGETFYGNVNAPSYSCSSVNCSARDWDLLAGNTPAGVAIDCHSNLYMLGGGGASGLIAKFINQDQVPAGACSTLNRFAQAPPPTLAVLSLHVGKIGKGTVLVGCSGKPCTGTLSLKSRSALCRACMLSGPRHFRVAPGLQRPLSLQLTRLGRRLLRTDPGLTIEIIGRMRGGRKFARDEILREPASLSAVCKFPGSFGGAASVSGTLTPARGGERITIQYLPPDSPALLLPAVQRTVLTDRSGRFHDSYDLNGPGKWIIAVAWAGDRTREPASPQPCSGTVQQIQTRLTLTCPVGSTVGAPTPLSGGLSGAPAGAPVALDYVEPPGTAVGHGAIAGNGGQFSDSFSPTAPGLWMALAHYEGDAGRAPAEAVCQFTVVLAPSALTVQCTPDPNRRFISCTGQLTSGGAGIGGAGVKLTYEPPPGGGSATVDTASTAANGAYTDTLNAPASSVLASGAWQVQAMFAGDGTHAPASNTTSVTVP
jgi:hypothetical protein